MIEKVHFQVKSGQRLSQACAKSSLGQRPFAYHRARHETMGDGMHSDHSLNGIHISPDQLVPSVQPKLLVSPPGDRYEQEADRMAEQVMSSISYSDNILPQGKRVECAGRSKDNDKLRPRPVADGLPSAVRGADIEPELSSAIQQSKGRGQPLSDGLRQPMEQAFRTDFAGVRIHVDHQADSFNREIQARAFTAGQDIFFRDTAYRPGTLEGRRLLAHELTHVVQQQSGNDMLQRDDEVYVAPILNSFIVDKARYRSSGIIGLSYNRDPGWWYSRNSGLAGWRDHPLDWEIEQGAQNPPPAGEGVVNWGNTYTCNLFVYDTLYDAGLIPPIQTNGHYYDASQTYSLSGSLRSYFDIITSPSAVRPGDVMATGGHMEIVASTIENNRFEAIGAHVVGAYQTTKTYNRTWKFLRVVVLGDFNIPSAEDRYA